MTTLLQQINDALEDAVRERGFDSRMCYTRVSTAPPAASEITIEATDRVVLDEVARRVGRDAPARYVLLPDDRGALPDGLIAASSVVDVRREPSHASELRTQIVLGDGVEPLREDGEWTLVRLDDGYIGWIRNWHLLAVGAAAVDRFRAKARHRVAFNHAEVVESMRPDALPVTDLVIGTGVIARSCGARGWRRVELADGRRGYIRSRSVEPVPRRARISRERLAATGLRFLGIPYIWGGTTPKGFDCSGLIQRIFRLNGLLLPRDADMQAKWGQLRPGNDLEAFETGDLLFFGARPDQITHVAMMLSDGLFLHGYGQVRVGSLDPAHRLYEAKLARIQQFTRDPLAEPPASAGP